MAIHKPISRELPPEVRARMQRYNKQGGRSARAIAKSLGWKTIRTRMPTRPGAKPKGRGHVKIAMG